MTLAQAILVIVAVGTPVVLFWAYGRYAYADLCRLEALDEWSTKFFSSTKQLLAKEDLPSEWVQMLSTLNESLNSKDAAFIVYKTYRNMLSSDRVKKDAGLTSEEQAFVVRNVETTELFINTCRAAWMAMSYTSLFWGVPARSVMSEHMARGSKPAVAVRHVERVGKAIHDRAYPHAIPHGA